MHVLINDLKRHHEKIAAELSTSVNRVLARGWFILGPEVDAFEAEFARYCGTAYAVGVANGTDALELALRALDLGPDAEVATVANAGMYSTTSIVRAGALPLYIDVDETSMNMDPASLRAAISPATKAVIVTHLYGRMAEMEDLLAVAAEHNIPVIEDCAHAHGAARAERKAGSWGMLGCFSFYPTKNLGAAGDAGAVVTSNPELAVKVRSLRQYGWTSKYCSSLAGGTNSRLDDLQAAVLRTKLPHLDAWNARRREIAALYNRALEGSGVRVPASISGPDYVAHLYVIRTPRRDEIRAALAEQGIATDVHYPVPDHLQSSLAALPIRPTPLPVTARCAAEVLTLPCFPELTDEEIEEVARFLQP